MKKITFVLLLMIPCLCWGQQGRIEMSEDMKRVEVKESLELRAVKGDSLAIQAKIRLLPEEVFISKLVCLAAPQKEEYEVIVFDPGFESFLATQKSKDFYSEWTLKAKNTLMVNEWNSRHLNPMKYNPNIYEVSIDYDSKIEYGLDVEYQLYMFFRFMEKEHKMSLIGDYYASN